MSEFLSLLPYETSSSKREAALQLAEIIGVPERLVPRDADANQVVAAMAGVVLHRHIERHQKREVMVLINQFRDSHPAFYSQLQGKIALTIAQPRWERWSLTNEELEEIIEFHRNFGRFSTVTGINPAAYGIGATVWQMISHGVTKGNVVGFTASVVLTGIGEASYATGEAASRELERRTQRTSINPASPVN